MRGRLFLGLLGACGAVSASGGCGDGTPAPRGFGSFQVVPTREVVAFDGFGDGYVVYDVTHGDGTKTYWRLDTETATPQELGPSLPATLDPPSRFVCTVVSTDNGATFTVTDTQTGIATSIDHVTVSSLCPTEADPSATVWRPDGAGHLTLWTGPYDDVQPVALPVLVVQVVSLGLTDGTTRVTAEQPDAPGKLGLYDIDDHTHAVSELVPPALAAATWAEGATPVGPLASDSVTDPVTPFLITELGDRIFYERTMSDGGTTVFVSPIPPAPPGEVALFRVEPGAILTAVALQVAGSGIPPRSPAWTYISTTAQVLWLWDAQSGRLVTCRGLDEFQPMGYASADGRQFLVGVQTDGGPSPALEEAAVVLISPDGNGRDGTCTVLGADHTHDPRMSADGALAWLVDAPGQATALWTAAGDGTGAREIGHGSIEEMPWAPYFYDSSRLELRLDHDLAWVDVHDDPVKIHYLAEQVFERAIDYTSHVIIGYEFSGQDGTGTLGIIDRATGSKRRISSQVVTYEASYPTSSDSPIANYVVYLVRGRNPSSQDGIWIATIGKDDLR